VVYVERIGKTRSGFRILVEKNEEERQLDRSWCRWETNIVNKCYRNVDMRTCNTLMSIGIFVSTVINLFASFELGVY
jgi:hypothetical protein